MWLYKLISKTIKIDIFDLNYAYSSEESGTLYIKDHNMPRFGVIVRVLSFIKGFVFSLFSINFDCFFKLKEKKLLFFVSTSNQYESIKKIHINNSNSEVLGTFGFGNIKFPILLSYLSSLFFLPKLIIHYSTSKNYKRKSFKYSFDQYWLSYGLYFISRIGFKYLKPNIVVFSNDHSFENRSVLRAAIDENITTIFIQHASVTKTLKFPKLIYNYAFLEGLDSLQKYDSYGKSKTKVFLVGQSKADDFIQFRNKSNEIKNLGICVSSLDIIEKVEEVCLEIIKKFPKLKLKLRPHPSDKRFNGWKQLSKKLEINFSDAKNESSFKFLQMVDSIITGDSNIVLESVVMNVYPIRYVFADKMTDFYGFIHSGIVMNAYNNPNDLLDRLDELINYKPNIQYKSKAYNDVVGTKYEGKSTLIIVELINNIIITENIIYKKKWIRMKGIKNLEAYHLIGN